MGKHDAGKICGTVGCPNDYSAKGFCRGCYNKLRRIRHLKEYREFDKSRKFDEISVSIFRKDNGMKKLNAKKRYCLKCDGKFISEGNHNRLCDRCRRTNSTENITDLYEMKYPGAA